MKTAMEILNEVQDKHEHRMSDALYGDNLKMVLDAINTALGTNLSEESYSEEQMEKAWNDGGDCMEQRGGFFDINNYQPIKN